MSTILSSSQEYLTTHLSLFMQLVYQWNVGDALLDAALQQIGAFLERPDAAATEAVTSVSLPLKRAKKQKGVEVSLEQSLSLLQAVVDDSIAQWARSPRLTLRSSVYSQDTLQRVHTLLQRVLPSLAQFAFARPAVSTELADDAASEATLSFFFRLAALLLKEETFSALTAFLAQSKAQEAQEAQQEEASEAGRVPRSYRELRRLLSEATFDVGATGHLFLSLLHLLLSYTQHITAMGFIDAEVGAGAAAEA